MSRSLLHSIIRVDPELLNIYDCSLSFLQNHINLPIKKAQTIHAYLKSSSPDSCLKYLSSIHVFPLTYLDSDYPTLLKEIYDPPFVLYGMGHRGIIQSKKNLAIIGSRSPTSTGSQTVAKLIPALSKQGLTIVSGFAKGIDSIAHWKTIQTSGRTMAILGSGHLHMYPKENVQLFSQMSKNQLILSEYPPDTPPQKWHFPARNRIISGMSKGVLVIEAKEKSGSLITADQALEQGRDVYAIPGSIFSPLSKGTNYLIQQGAKLVMSAEDILEDFQ